MTHLKICLVLVAAGATLGACGKPAEKAAEPAATTAPAPVSLTTLKRKPGLWEQQMSMVSDNGGPAMKQTASVCVDPTSEGEMAAMDQQMSQGAKCSEQRATRRPDGGIDFSSICPMGDSGVISTQGVMSGDFNAAYTMEMTSTTVGAASERMNGEHKMTLTATWKGPCPPDMKPGDMRLAGMPGMPQGATFNPAEQAKARPMPDAAQIEAMKARAEAIRKQTAN